jgi:LacI family transcriptional regulator
VCIEGLHRRPWPDALVCYNDILALTVMKELSRFGVKLPDDISIVGIENINCGLYSSPALTTVDLQSSRYGEPAMLMLLRSIREGVRNNLGHILLEPRLVERASTVVRA